MPFVSRSDGEDEDVSSAVPSGAPPMDWDPNDPDTVNVLYDVSAWSLDQRAELAAAFADAGHPHAWEGDELVVPEEIEDAVDELFDRLERELGPFPVGLAGDLPSTEFGLDEWPPADIELLQQALLEAEIPHRWDGSTLHVAPDAEHVVDDLLDAIEAGDLATLGDEAGGAPEGALNDVVHRRRSSRPRSRAMPPRATSCSTSPRHSTPASHHSASRCGCGVTP